MRSALPALVLCLSPGTAAAHAAEGGFVLLLPTRVYIAAGCGAVALSVVIIALLPAGWLKRLFRPVILGRGPVSGGARRVTSLLTLALAAALVVTGFAGPRDPLTNLLPLTVWTLFWIGFVSTQGVLGDLWAWLNPWQGLYRVTRGDAPPPLRLPEWLGHWPAVVLLLVLSGFALADPAPADPARLAAVVLGYGLFTFSGMALFGVRDWLGRVELLTVLLRLYARLAPVQCDRRIRIGLPGWAVLAGPVPNVSLAVFILVLLGSGSFDGLKGTFWWLARIGINPLEFSGRSAVMASTLLGLLAANLALIAAFGISVAAGLWLLQWHGPATPVPNFRRSFAALAVSVLPIAFGYHVAHFLTAFLVDGQYVLAALADLLGLGQVHVSTGFLKTRDSVHALWLSQAAIIVAAHVLGVLMAHRIANRLFGAGRRAMIGQIPLALFMVLYTLLGLWLLAAPRGA